MKVSVVIPTYNRAYIIRDALESALAQTHKDYEIIIVDDGSTDNTRELVESYGNAKIRYVRHEQNRGCSAACNTGIAEARGELVGFLDSDDCWKPDYLERQVGFFLRHPQVSAVFTDVEIVGDRGTIPSLIALMKRFQKVLERKPKAEEYILDGQDIYLCLLEEVPIKPTALVTRREIYAKAGTFDESWPSGTDWALFLRIFRTGSFGYIHRALAIQRRTADATHMIFREKDKLYLLDVFLKEREKLKDDPEAMAAVNRGILGHCNDLGWDYLHAGQRKKSLAAYMQGFRETRKSVMLLRAACVYMPLGVRQFVGASLKKG
jgi:glycosyltransferase involved in cell wall biosynthesis